MSTAGKRPQSAARPGMARFVVARVGDIPEGERKIVDVAGRQVGIFRIDGEFHAILHRCPHLGGPLCLGLVVGMIEADRPGELRFDASRKFLVCPWHGWEFDITTGRSYCDPRTMRARRYPVEIEAGEQIAAELEGAASSNSDLGARVPGPYVAEIVPVSIDGDFIVLTMRQLEDEAAATKGGAGA